MVSLRDNPLLTLGVLEVLTAGCMPDVIGMCSVGYHWDGRRECWPRGVVGTDLGMDLGTTNRGTQTNKPRVSPTVPSAPLQIAPQTISVLTLRLPLCNPTGSPLHDLRDPQRKPEDSRDKDGREKGGKEKGPEGDGKRHTGHRRVLQTKNPQGVAVNSLGGRLKDSIKVGHSISSFYCSG